MHLTTKSIALLAFVIAAAPGLQRAESAERADSPPPEAELPAFPVRPSPDPARVSGGRALFSVNCSFCHGATAKGGESGPSLVRSAIVLHDKDGELIEPIVKGGIPGKGMPYFSLSTAQIGDIAAFIHSIPALAAPVTVNSLVGDPKAGEAYFNGAGKCAGCHLLTGELAHIGSKFKPRDLQSAMVAGGRRGMGLATFFALPLFISPGTTARITLPSGAVHSGTLQHVDEFTVSIVDSATGSPSTFVRDGVSPKVEIHDPIQAHLDLLRVYKDSEIQNLTAYLATLK